MPRNGILPPRPVDDSPNRFTIDITVPDVHADRNGFLRSAWQQQAVDGMPVPRLALPRRSEGDYAIRIRQTHMADLVVQDLYSDAVTWSCKWEEGITTVVPLQGAARLSLPRRDYSVGPGLVSANRNEKVWDWEIHRGTRGLVLVLPARDVGFPKYKQLVTADQNTPAAQLLLAHVRSWTHLSGALSPAAEWAARNATLELFRGVLNDQIIDDEDFSSALVLAAMDYMEGHLLDDPDLTPGTVADFLRVSVRTLHRAFTNEETSVMGYVRERRLQHARADVMSTSLTVAEIAARWYFTDSSHFVGAFKRRFGEPPAALRQRQSARGGERTGKEPDDVTRRPG